MNIRRTAIVALSVAVLGAASASSASADEWTNPGDTIGEEFIYPKSSSAMPSMPSIP